jgi:TolA-binding protein
MNVLEREAGQPTAELVALARRALHGDSVLSDAAGFARLEQRMRPRPTWQRGWLVGGLVAFASSAALIGTLWLTHDDAITFQVAGGTVAKDGRIIGAEATRIRFSDGSEATLARGAEARVENLTEHGAAVVLNRGSMRVHIAKRPQAAWTVAAGPYDVQVTGTAFDVSWSTQEQAFDLRMQSGAVVVTGPLALSGIGLKAGQHLFGGVAEGRLTVEGNDAPSITPPQAAVAALEPVAERKAPTPGPTLSPTPPAARGAAEPHAWTKQVAQGHFAAVLEEAEQRGLDRLLSGGSLEELAALADAARYAGRNAIAKRVLLAERQRFASSGPARDAAFFLGRIAEDSGGGAVEWYERYVQESPRGPYASQAFGRKMMLLYKQRGPAAAKPVAAEYLSRFPNGPYAAAARKLEQESSPAPRP